MININVARYYDGNSNFQFLQGIALGNANRLIIADSGCYGKGSYVHTLTLDGDLVEVT